MRIKTLSDVKIPRGARVLVRGDFDAVIQNGKIKDDFRLSAILPTIQLIARRGGRLRLMGHLGRPHGKRAAHLSLKPVALYLSRILKRKIIFMDDPRRFDPEKDRSSNILFFENLRFFKGEEENSYLFAERLARWGDVYIDDAFANAHRAHASMDRIGRRLPSAAGLRFAQEVDTLSRLLHDLRYPALAVLGGAKLETKLPFIEKFLKMGYEVLVGGALANTIFYAKKIPLGKSPINIRLVSLLRRIIANPHLHLPVDFSVAPSVKSSSRISAVDGVRRGEINCDIGPATVRNFSALIGRAQTVVWNGPLGFAERRRFAQGTVAVARAITGGRAFSLVGGGDTIALLSQYGALKGFSHISTGGGAMLEFLAGKKLPGVEVLKNK